MKKKSQGAIEFMIIFVITLLLISLTMSVLSIITVDIQNNEKKKEIDNFAKSISSEFDLIFEVKEGYSRNITIPFHLAKRFKPQINSSYLILTDSENDDDSTNKYYYYLPENITYSLTNDSSGNYYLYLQKNVTQTFEGITLINN